METKCSLVCINLNFDPKQISYLPSPEKHCKNHRVFTIDLRVKRHLSARFPASCTMLGISLVMHQPGYLKGHGRHNVYRHLCRHKAYPDMSM